MTTSKSISRRPDSARAELEVVAEPTVAAAATAYARRKLEPLATKAGAPVLHARVRLSTAPDPAVERPALAQVVLDVDGRLVRAHVAAHDMTEAIDLLQQRLRSQLRHLTERRVARRRGRARGRLTTGPSVEWPTGRPAWFERPPEERQLVRRKTVSPAPSSLEEAVFDMELLDSDFLLFRELGTGTDAVIHRRPDGRCGLCRPEPPVGAAAAAPAESYPEVEVEPPLPRSTVGAAIDRLDTAGEPFVAFVDAKTGRVRVVYRRYDGHYGMITQADEPAPPAEPSTARRRLVDELQRLESVRRALLADELDVEPETSSIGEITTIDQHPADLGTETFERESALSLLQDVEGEIADVRRALIRVDRRTYGRCDVCQAEIPDERLAAMPAARFCLLHQQGVESPWRLGT